LNYPDTPGRSSSNAYSTEQEKLTAKTNDILPLLNDALEIQENIHELYRSSFEDLGTCSDEEKAFEWQMNLAFLKLDTITAKSKLIDGEKGPVADMDVIG
jgi:hypothetical protein